MTDIAMLIPCYNEGQTVGAVIEDCRRNLPEAVVYVYDNNSSDDTVAQALAHGATVRHEYRQGKGNVVRSMFRDIEADVYVMVDGDDTYPLDNVRDMVAPVLRGEADMVIGDRLSSTYFEQEKRASHNMGNRLVRKLINSSFHSDVQDIMTGYRAFSRDFVKSFPVLSEGFEIETEMTIHTLDKNLKWVEVPCQYRDRQEGSVSKLNTYSDGFKVLKKIATLLYELKPLAFFSFFAVISLVIGLVGLAIPTIEYWRTNVVAKFPTLIAGVLFTLVALLLWSTGLICNQIAKKHRQLFEINLNLLHR